ncbi:M20/M25/M40 family metallo-hydrolase [Undibacterium sp. FT137W]|uniref:M20/M25/M40 family metallo-hydrolase n=2 Tax=Undibacterium fentianense TaxID=2828728 RepID=A0A941DX48_9BURK|nr:M20/M25/M40 family metallo-hydrolase [Undibacterium fentianense]
MQATINRISAESMRGHLNFLASDLLEGRDTPSRGLDLAAEYIAAQFRAIGLEPAGNEGYFQTADWNILKKEIRRRPGAAVPPPEPEPATPTIVRNVIGVLRGSDPALKDSYVLVTAHYDHIGMKANAEGDKIFNGANDDASGTVSVIELAKAFAGMKERPKRSIVFMTFFGEEKGLVGSRYYGKNPIFPIEKTVAGINIEQVGRTDDSEGPQVASVGVTGFDFSEVGAIIKQAGDKTGIHVWKHPVNSDRYFGASDNQALADQGIPAHTISVAYGFPDYHGLGDEAHKIDYDNMAKVNRAVAVAIEHIANSAVAPNWDEKNPKAAKYLEAWKQRHTAK